MSRCVFPWIQLLTSCYRCIAHHRPEHKTKYEKAIFRFIDIPMSWYNADYQCKRIGGRLVEIDTAEENEALMGEIRKRGFQNQRKQFWMGLTDRGVSDNVDQLKEKNQAMKTFQCNIGDIHKNLFRKHGH